MVVSVQADGGIVSVSTIYRRPNRLDLAIWNEGEGVWPKVIASVQLNKLQAQALREGLGQLIRGLD